jgi:hypothetical protein
LTIFVLRDAPYKGIKEGFEIVTVKQLGQGTFAQQIKSSEGSGPA